MIHSVNHLSQTLDQFSRGLATTARHAARLATPADEPVRPVDNVDNQTSVGIGLPQTEESRPQPQEEVDLSSDIARNVAQEAAARSSIAVVKTADQMVGSLLDVMA